MYRGSPARRRRAKKFWKRTLPFQRHTLGLVGGGEQSGGGGSAILGGCWGGGAGVFSRRRHEENVREGQGVMDARRILGKGDGGEARRPVGSRGK